jgi:arylsulfatase A-like enzyme
MPDKLNVILIQLDSLNRHFLTCYGNDWVQAPNLAAFARKAAIFDSHFTGSLPCMPARREIWAGTQEFWWRGWGPLEPWDQPIAYLARQAEQPITTQLVTDHYHFFEWGSHNYHYDFHGYDFIRGHEYDNWRSDPIRAIPDWAQKMVERRTDEVLLYIRNVQDFEQEEDFFAPKVMQATTEWLDRNHSQEQFYLHIDSFDVHEPFHVPEPYRSLYTDADYREHNPWPAYGRVDEGPTALSPEEVAWVRAQFAGKLTMVDRWLGRVFERLDRYNLWERTCVIVTTDHGHYLGDHGWIGKPNAPLYHTLCHIPLLVWHPSGAHNGGRVSAMTQTIDLYATVVELLGGEPPRTENVHSRSFAPVLLDQTDTHRDSAVYAYYNQRIGLTAGEWTLLRYHDPDAAPPLIYTQQVEQTAGNGYDLRERRRLEFEDLEPGRFIPGVETPVWRRQLRYDTVRHYGGTREDLLFHNLSDPNQTHNLAAERPDMVESMVAKLRAHAQAVKAPEEQFKRLHL